MAKPSPNGANGRDEQGRFAPGNPGGPGNPHAAAVGRLRAALLDAVTEGDIRAVAQALVSQAKQGDVAAARELLARIIGKPIEWDLLARIEALEEQAKGVRTQ